MTPTSSRKIRRPNPLHPPEVAAAIEHLHQFLAAEQNSESSTSREMRDKSLQSKDSQSESDLKLQSQGDASYDAIYKALTIVLNESEYQILGVCAASHAEGMQALQQYLTAFGEDAEATCTDPGKPIYIKYNTKTQTCYSEPYDGYHRGVIVSCQSAYDDGVNETFGHLPLDLFAS